MKPNRRTDIATVALFLAVLFGLSAAFVILPDRTHSDNENRDLQTLPQADIGSVLDGSFSSDINTYFADQFPLRDMFVGIKAAFELALCKGENNGVMLGAGSTLAVRDFTVYQSRLLSTPDMDRYYTETVRKQLAILNDYALSSDIPVYAVLPPRTVDVASESFMYPSTVSESLMAETAVLSEEIFVPVYDMLKDKYDSGEYVMYRTDHHWTTLGAYYAYCGIMEHIGMGDSVIPKEDFTVSATSGFYGTSWSKSGFRFVPGDTIELWYFGNEDEFTTNTGDGSFSGFYNTDWLSEKDKYSVFIDGTHSVTTVKKSGGEPRETLLVAKDSFADSLVPFLAQHFDLVIVNLAGRMTDLTAYAAEYSADRVLIVWNFENLITTGTIGNLK